MNRLYHFPFSPFSRKARLVLAEKRIEVELVEEKFWQDRPDFRRLNPAGKVPVLKTAEITLSESNAICEYLEEKYPNPPLMPKNLEDRAEVRRLVSWFDDKFYTEVTVNLLGERMMKKVMGIGYPESSKVKEGSRQIKMHLDYMEWLLDRRRWLAGGQLSLADFSAAAQISCLDYISDVDWDRAPLVKSWYATLKSRPAFRSILADQISGFPQPPHYADLDF